MNIRNIVFSGLLTLAGSILPATAHAENSNAEKPVYRNNTAFSVNYSNLSIGSKPYGSGVSVDVYSDVNIPVSEKISFNPKLNASYFSYGVIDDNATEELKTFDLSLEGRVVLGSKAYVGLGGEYLLDDELMLYKDSRGHIKRRSVGPVFTFGINSDNCDFSVSASELFGHKWMSFDKKRLIRTEHLNLSVVPRSKEIELRTMIDFFHSAIADIPGDRSEYFLKFTFQPSADVSENFSVFPNISYIFKLFGHDKYNSGEVGLGARIKW